MTVTVQRNTLCPVLCAPIIVRHQCASRLRLNSSFRQFSSSGLRSPAAYLAKMLPPAVTIWWKVACSIEFLAKIVNQAATCVAKNSPAAVMLWRKLVSTVELVAKNDPPAFNFWPKFHLRRPLFNENSPPEATL